MLDCEVSHWRIDVMEITIMSGLRCRRGSCAGCPGRLNRGPAGRRAASPAAGGRDQMI